MTIALNTNVATAHKSLVTRLNDWWQLRRLIRQDRKAMRRLLSLDNHILADIGLTHDDVVWATRLPSTTLAGAALSKRAD